MLQWRKWWWELSKMIECEKECNKLVVIKLNLYIKEENNSSLLLYKLKSVAETFFDRKHQNELICYYCCEYETYDVFRRSCKCIITILFMLYVFYNKTSNGYMWYTVINQFNNFVMGVHQFFILITHCLRSISISTNIKI